MFSVPSSSSLSHYSGHSVSAAFIAVLVFYYLYVFSLFCFFIHPPHPCSPHAHSSDCLDIRAARTLLDNDHYAMDKLKRRVLEYLAVRQLKTSLKVLSYGYFSPLKEKLTQKHKLSHYQLTPADVKTACIL